MEERIPGEAREVRTEEAVTADRRKLPSVRREPERRCRSQVHLMVKVVWTSGSFQDGKWGGGLCLGGCSSVIEV